LGLALAKFMALEVSLYRVKPLGLALASRLWLHVRTVRYRGMIRGPGKLPPLQCSLHMDLHMEQHMEQHPFEQVWCYRHCNAPCTWNNTWNNICYNIPSSRCGICVGPNLVYGSRDGIATRRLWCCAPWQRATKEGASVHVAGLYRRV